MFSLLREFEGSAYRIIQQVGQQFVAGSQEMYVVAVHQSGIDPTIAAAKATHDAVLIPDGSVAFAGKIHHGLLHLLCIAVANATLTSYTEPAVVIGDEEKADIRIDMAQFVHKGAV